MKKYILTALVAIATLSVSAQQVSTLYFLENNTMRHTLNPAFQPVSNGYVNFSPLGWMSYGVGNNSFTLSDFIYYDNKVGATITPLHPQADRNQLLRQIRSMTYFNTDATLGLLNVGVRIKDAGYLHVGINMKMESGVTLPKSMFDFFLNGGMKDLNGGNNLFSLSGLSSGATIYTEISGGYSHQLNEHWTIGGKLKFLLGTAYVGVNAKRLDINASTESWRLQGDLGVTMAALPVINDAYMAGYMNNKDMRQVVDGFKDGTFDASQLVNYTDPMSLVVSALTPAGYGAGLDFGFTWKPIEQLQVTAAITDLGFIYWTSGSQYNCKVDTLFEGAGLVDYNDPKYQGPDGQFSTDSLMGQVTNNLMGMLSGFKMSSNQAKGFARMTSARLNVGLDANFWDNRVGVGVLSATRLYNARLYEEVTFGVAFRPVNWFNIAATYSLINNGKYSNIGAGISFMPYDGLNFLLAADYLPTRYAKIPGSSTYGIPDQMKMFNISMGVSICWGSNRKDKDKDGVWDKIDMCPDTPRGIAVDSLGCPLDEDHDGVPDYLDHCLGTLSEAVAYVDTLGCDKDTDGDGVEDYRDLCPNTPREAWGKVDNTGCPMDTDGDGVADYLDECPGTPEAAYGRIDAKGCPLDSDGDGVADYLDECPGTPEAAHGKVNDKGCPTDGDGDGVPDYLDECPDTPGQAIGFVDAKGCELDSDGDEVPDYKDACPNVAGLKENKGCPELKREVRQLLQKAMQGIEFESGKATIKSKSYPLLDQIAAIFIENTNYIIEVQGHTDNTGKEEANKALSQKRADAVRDYMIAKGVDFQRLTAVGYGQEQPIADNATKAGRAKNRRVEFKINFEEVHYETVLEHADPQPVEETPAETSEQTNIN